MTTPRVSVLMAAFNAAGFIRESIESILAQTYRDFEFMIVDDGSTDESAAIAQSYRDPRIIVLRNERNVGLTASLNRGLRAAAGELIARQDADDISDPQRLELEVEALATHPNVALVGTQAKVMDADGASLGELRMPIDPLSIRWAQMFDNCFIHSAVMFRRSVALELGGYDEAFRISQDYALWSRIMRGHDTMNLDEKLLSLRVHASSLMRSRRAETDDESRRIIAENIRETVGDLGDMEKITALVAQYRWRVEPESLGEFHAVFSEMLARFQKENPQSKTSPNFRRTVAEQYARIGYNLLPEHRAAAFAEFRRVLRGDARVFARLPWLRIAALALFGDAARSLYLRLAKSRRAGANSATLPKP
jgi:hypothetical protein